MPGKLFFMQGRPCDSFGHLGRAFETAWPSMAGLLAQKNVSCSANAQVIPDEPLSSSFYMCNVLIIVVKRAVPLPMFFPSVNPTAWYQSPPPKPCGKVRKGCRDVQGWGLYPPQTNMDHAALASKDSSLQGTRFRFIFLFWDILQVNIEQKSVQPAGEELGWLLEP